MAAEFLFEDFCKVFGNCDLYAKYCMYKRQNVPEVHLYPPSSPCRIESLKYTQALLLTFQLGSCSINALPVLNHRMAANALCFEFMV